MTSPDAELVDQRHLKKITLKREVLDGYASAILNPSPLRAIRVTETGGSGKPVSMVFVARNEDVATVLANEARFSIKHYTQIYKRVAPGSRLIMHEKDDAREERRCILHSAMAETPWFDADTRALHAVASECVQDVLAAYQGRRPRQFDLIGEYGFFIPYLVCVRMLGLPGPQYWGLIPRLVCYLKNFPKYRPFTAETGPYLTQLLWSQYVFADLFGDFEGRAPFYMRILARCGDRKMRAHIRDRIKYLQYLKEPPSEPTLLWALLAVRDQYPEVPADRYEEHVVSLLLELMGTAHAIPGLAFAEVVMRWEDDGLHFDTALRNLEADNLDAFTDESLRMSPPGRQLLRIAVEDTVVGGVPIARGEYLCALVSGGGMDPRAVENPSEMDFSRDLSVYLHFGPLGGDHRCAGWRLGRAILGEMFAGLKTLAELEALEPLKRWPTLERKTVQFWPGSGS